MLRARSPSVPRVPPPGAARPGATRHDDLRGVVGQALDEGVTLDKLVGRLRGLFEETYLGWALTVASTEAQVADSKASVLGYQESGVVASTELADNPDHTEDYGAADGLSCSQRHGLIVPLDQADVHIEAEHPNGSLACLPVLIKPLGED